MNLAARDLQKGDTCYAELSTNGGSTWTNVLQVGDGLDTGTFRSAQCRHRCQQQLESAPASRDPRQPRDCWGDEIVVRAHRSAQLSMPDRADSLLTVAGIESTALTAAASGEALEYGSPSFNLGFDPGFDHLFGDGSVDRQSLSYELLMSGEALDGPVDSSAYAVPAGAAPPENVFEGCGIWTGRPVRLPT
jgi:hypothetical protein